MIDIHFLRQNAALVKENYKKRRDPAIVRRVDEVLAKDAEWKKLKQESDELRKRRNELSLEINKLKKEGKPADKLLKEASLIPAKLKAVEEKMRVLASELNLLLMNLPNLTHESVPYGKDSSENVELRRWGKPARPDFELVPHGELAEGLGLADFKRGAKVAGAGFVYVKKELALLDLALQRFGVDFMLKKGYELVMPPLMLNREAYAGVTNLADFENVMYKIENENLYMIATSEHPLVAQFKDEVLQESDLPVRIVGVSPCFRKEIGSHGVDTRGFFRMHQFNKVEQIVICRPDDSWKFFDELLNNAEELMQELEIPYRVVNVCTGDLSFKNAKMCDVEAWFPRRKEYAEVGSCSNCTAYQSVRLNIRFQKGQEREYVHTLNSTGIATSRVLVAILENYQNKDGTITVPKVLQKYMNGTKVIGKPAQKQKSK